MRAPAKILAITNGVHVPTLAGPAHPRGARRGRRPVGGAPGAQSEMLAAVASAPARSFDPDVLTLAGAPRRRLQARRPDLLRPGAHRAAARGRLQLVFAGKAHPDDGEGKRLVATLSRWRAATPAPYAFVPDYDMALGRCLTRGGGRLAQQPATPARACRDLGMKATLNGVLNFSVPTAGARGLPPRLLRTAGRSATAPTPTRAASWTPSTARSSRVLPAWGDPRALARLM